MKKKTPSAFLRWASARQQREHHKVERALAILEKTNWQALPIRPGCRVLAAKLELREAVRRLEG